jgi:NADH-quinone oxidoreductase subunit N
MATLGAFSVVSIIGGRLGRDAEIDDFRGCWKTMPSMAGLMFFFILSLAGIPPLAGFIGKYYLFFAAIKGHASISGWSEGWYWLVALALVMSVVSLYYYLRVLKAFLVFDEEGRTEVKINPVVRMALIILALGVIGLGLFPQPVLDIFIAAS